MRRIQLAIESILKELDTEIARLLEVRKLLSNAGTESVKKSTTAKKRSKRSLSPEARARIAAAQRKRWAAIQKSAKK
jgi:ElaB/YqjD/DUF883 family membrane-anchored ribosome-binding protein